LGLNQHRPLNFEALFSHFHKLAIVKIALTLSTKSRSRVYLYRVYT